MSCNEQENGYIGSKTRKEGMQHPNCKKLTVEVPEKIFYNLKVAAAVRNEKIKTLVSRLLLEALKKWEAEGTIPRLK